jgi:hypothetical protein
MDQCLMEKVNGESAFALQGSALASGVVWLRLAVGNVLSSNLTSPHLRSSTWR